MRRVTSNRDPPSNSGPLQPTDKQPRNRVYKITSSGPRPSTNRQEAIPCQECSGKLRTDKEEQARVRNSSSVDPEAATRSRAPFVDLYNDIYGHDAALAQALSKGYPH